MDRCRLDADSTILMWLKRVGKRVYHDGQTAPNSVVCARKKVARRSWSILHPLMQSLSCPFCSTCSFVLRERVFDTAAERTDVAQLRLQPLAPLPDEPSFYSTRALQDSLLSTGRYLHPSPRICRSHSRHLQRRMTDHWLLHVVSTLCSPSGEEVSERWTLSLYSKTASEYRTLHVAVSSKRPSMHFSLRYCSCSLCRCRWMPASRRSSGGLKAAFWHRR